MFVKDVDLEAMPTSIFFNDDDDDDDGDEGSVVLFMPPPQFFLVFNPLFRSPKSTCALRFDARVPRVRHTRGEYKKLISR